MAALSSAVKASGSPEEIDSLRQQIKLLTERLDKLEEQPIETVNQSKKFKSSKAKIEKSIADRLSFKADFRERYEIIDQQGKEKRDRNRLRLRAALGMRVNNDLSFTLGMATGGDDPVSTNQTLDGGFSTKDIRLDLAYFDYKFNDSLKLTGGKIKNPLYRPGKNSALWDSDLNPEGFALRFNNNFLQASLVGFAVEERKAASDSYMMGGQVIHGFKMSDTSKLLAGVGYYNYSNLQGNEPLYDGKARGNSVDVDGSLTNDYNIAEFFAEFKTKFVGKSLAVYVNYFKNSAADDFDTAYTLGVKFGKVKGAGTWDVGMSYINNEADSIVGLFNDSDFAGGNTDAKGITLKAGYGLKKNMALGLAYINSEIGQSQITPTDYNRLQLDFKLKFK